MNGLGSWDVKEAAGGSAVHAANKTHHHFAIIAIFSWSS